MTPEQRRFCLVKVIWEDKTTGERDQTRPVVPEDLPDLLNSIRAFNHYRALYAIRYCRLRPVNPPRRPEGRYKGDGAPTSSMTHKPVGGGS